VAEVIEMVRIREHSKDKRYIVFIPRGRRPGRANFDACSTDLTLDELRLLRDRADEAINKIANGEQPSPGRKVRL
jgi:hypothetical protein